MIKRKAVLNYFHRWRGIILLLLLATPLLGQDGAFEITTTPTRYRKAIGIGLSAGTNAIAGLDLTFDFIPKFNFRLAYNRLQFDINTFTIETADFGVSDQTILADLTSNLSSIAVLADYGINERENIRIIAGLYVGLDNAIQLSGAAEQSLQFNDYEIPAEDVGTLQIAYASDLPVFPYLGIGIGRSVPFRRLNANLEIGAFYRGSPQINVTGTGLLAANEVNSTPLSENLSSFQFHPSVAVRIAYRIDVGKRKAKKENSLLNEFLTDLPSDNEEAEPQNKPQNEPRTPERNTAPIERPSIPGTADEYQTFKGFVVDADSGMPIDFFNMDIRLVKEDGSLELVRTGRYQFGRFAASLVTKQTYEFQILRTGYQSLYLRVPHDSGKSTEHTFKLKPLTK